MHITVLKELHFYLDNSVKNEVIGNSKVQYLLKMASE